MGQAQLYGILAKTLFPLLDQVLLASRTTPVSVQGFGIPDLLLAVHGPIDFAGPLFILPLVVGMFSLSAIPLFILAE